MSNKIRQEIMQAAKYEDLKKLVQIILTISHALEQAELNGRKPDFSTDYEGPIHVAKEQMKTLTTRLKKGSR